MADSVLVLDPVAPEYNETQAVRRKLETLAGKVVGFIDNAKPNFNHLVDDLAALLVSRYDVARVVKHRKSGQVPVDAATIDAFARECDAVLTGSGD